MFGKFRLERLLGRGGMGAVYLAQDSQLRRTVALKTILPEARGDPGLKARLLSEARAVAKLKHPGIVSIHEMGEEKGIPFLAMEFVEGEDLAKFSRKQKKGMDPKRAVELVIAVAEALGYAHEHGIVHRDLKPANIMIRRNGRPVVMDFGLAKDLDRAGGELSLTRSGDSLGTPMYMSPEQVQGRKDDFGAHTDVYALGAVLYELLSGKPPFDADTVGTLFAKILRDDPPPLHCVDRGLPADMDLVVERCLNKRPEARYADGTELAQTLKDVMAGKPADDLLLPLEKPETQHPAVIGPQFPPFEPDLPSHGFIRASPDRGVRTRAAPAFNIPLRPLVYLALLGFIAWGIYGWTRRPRTTSADGSWRDSFQKCKYDDALLAIDREQPPALDADVRRKRVQWEKLRATTRNLTGRTRLDVRIKDCITVRPNIGILVQIRNPSSEPITYSADSFYLRARPNMQVVDDVGLRIAFSVVKGEIDVPDGTLKAGETVVGGLAFPDISEGDSIDLIYNDGTYYQSLLVGTIGRMRISSWATLTPEWLGQRGVAWEEAPK
ncbi:MAG: protein kinase [Planctomycetes bacterium]|nr:protein kinase [Planctomycetota bacterium]